MNILSVFDGFSGGQLAFKRSGIKVNKYFASEINKYAIQITQKNFPNTIQLGDINSWGKWELPKIDFIIGGSPCQGFSFAGKQLNFEDPRSKLFFKFVDILNHIRRQNPEVKFLLENVKMKKEYQDVISRALGVEPININSNLVSAQNRNRFYWTNIKGVEQPQDRKIYLKDIIEHGFVDRDKSYCVDASYFKTSETSPDRYFRKSARQIVFEKAHGFNKCGFQERKKFATLRECTAHNYAIKDGVTFRKLTPIECERLQTIPDNYTEGVSNTQRYKMIGNGFTIDVITHILKGLNNEHNNNRQ